MKDLIFLKSEGILGRKKEQQKKSHFFGRT